MRYAAIALSCALVGWPLQHARAQTNTGEKTRIQAGLGEAPFVAVAAHPSDPRRVIAASPRALYESRDGGASWQERLRAQGEARITRIAVESADAPAFLAATDRGLYGSFDEGATWSRVFRGKSEREAACTVVAFHPSRPGRAVLGTRGGLFLSDDHGRKWKPAAVPAAARDVVDVALDPKNPERVYLLAARGLFVGSFSDGGWQRRLTAFYAEEPEVEEPAALDTSETAEENGSLHRLSAIAADPQHPSTLYLASSRGLARSADEGATWQPLPSDGLTSPSISRLLLRTHSPLVLYAATERGVARYKPERGRWTMMADGGAATHVHDLAESRHQLWAATNDGLYRYDAASDFFADEPLPLPRELLANFVNEPAIGEVREAAIRYAEVHPEKIARWRRQAALRALLPTFDIGIDRKRARNVHVDEGTFPRFQLFETEDRDAGVDFSVNWDLADLVWNDAQTTIDVRSKLMVQLRNDLVDDVTRTYFERRRIQVALLTNPPSDQPAILEKELRIQELTALIDGLTGGFFSKQIKLPEESSVGLR